VPSLDGFSQSARDIHYFAHHEHFIEDLETAPTQMRYEDVLFTRDHLELFESIVSEPDMTVVRFDARHAAIISGTKTGKVRWGLNRWTPDETEITFILPISQEVLSVGSMSGTATLFHDGGERSVECFRASMQRPSGKTVVAPVPNSPRAFIAQGNCEVLLWDLEALLMIDYCRLPANVRHIAIIENSLFCALETGIILQIGIGTLHVEREFRIHSGCQIIRIGMHQGILYSVLNSGEAFLWDNPDSPRLITNAGPSIVDFVMHSVVKTAILLTDAAAVTVGIDDGQRIELIGEGKPICCCFDDLQPLAAIGWSNGKIGIWRIPR
jgi:hypothetical protein